MIMYCLKVYIMEYLRTGLSIYDLLVGIHTSTVTSTLIRRKLSFPSTLRPIFAK